MLKQTQKNVGLSFPRMKQCKKKTKTISRFKRKQKMYVVKSENDLIKLPSKTS